MVLLVKEKQATPEREHDFETKSNSRTREDVDHLTKDAVDAYVSVAADALQSMDVPPLEAVLLYGSRARGDHNVESDADLALVLKGNEVGRTLQILEDLGQETHEIETKFEFMVSPTHIHRRMSWPSSTPSRAYSYTASHYSSRASNTTRTSGRSTGALEFGCHRTPISILRSESARGVW